ncbi:hypothetical protein HK407_12g18630 [Ordospora pajunii]|uniref:uncharacterized protein n=1 Tax=Ordospora pajunii TaxID=3039483 RepID=UPI002952612B|nr:uncharacterized protein HK407_12g18630 [Ordospora pajunii]KAH9410731.1 hypothetical protein HK407_12g18630 [Ordospora pajunii]
MANEDAQSSNKGMIMELIAIKKNILSKMSNKLEEVFSQVPSDVRKLPLLLLMQALEKNYIGDSIIIKKNVKDKKHSTSRNITKRPSVMLQVEDQSFVFDGCALRMVGMGNGEEEYKGMVDEINNILKKHMSKTA